MTKKQKILCKRLEKILNDIGKTGLIGAIFEGTFVLWNKNFDPFIMGISRHLMEHIEENGGIILNTSDICLDGGGAGI